jgi:Uma2 family endonuclease
MQEHAKKYLTPEEYLAMEETAEYKSEYYRGEIFAFAGGSANHNQIIINLIAYLAHNMQNRNCRLFTNDMKVWIEEKDLFTYPDVIVVCGKAEFYPDRDDTITNPMVIIEVLSESTENYDRVKKFGFYRSIPTFQEYILVNQYRVHIEHFYLESKGKWIFTDYSNENDILKFNKIDFEISLKDAYDRVEFKKQEGTESLRPSL